MNTSLVNASPNTAPKGDLSLIIKLIVGIIVGLILGFTLNQSGMQVIGSIKHILGQIIFYAVPLVIIGFIAPAITRLGENANKMLFSTVLIAYLSSVGAAFFAIFLGYSLIPFLSITTQAESLRALPEILFKLNIPPIMPVMTALITAIIFGITVLWSKARTIETILNEFEGMVMLIVTKFIIPILPFFIAASFAQLAYEGSITRQFPVFLQVIIIALVGHFIWLAFLYTLGGVISRRNPLKVLKHYWPAYLTAVGTMSSAATLPVSLSCAHKSSVLSKNTVDFVVPIGTTIHLCGSVITETLFCMTIAFLVTGALPTFGTLAIFVILLGIFAIGAPGVPGGTVMASMGIVISILGFDANSVALLLAIFALQDSFGTACNVTGDGAIALIIEGIFNPKAENLQDQTKLT